MKAEHNLKACPKCFTNEYVDIENIKLGFKKYICRCLLCNTSTNICSSKKSAVRSWNKRIVHNRKEYEKE